MTKDILINFTKDGFLRMDFDLGLDIPTDMIPLKNAILQYLDNQSEVLKKPEPDVWITGIGNYTMDIKILFWINVLKDKTIPPAYLGATIKSRIIGEVKTLLIAQDCRLQNPIMEHKMYDPEQPISVTVNTY
jgi:small-conductance mechanosensitive channel